MYIYMCVCACVCVCVFVCVYILVYITYRLFLIFILIIRISPFGCLNFHLIPRTNGIVLNDGSIYYISITIVRKIYCIASYSCYDYSSKHEDPGNYTRTRTTELHNNGLYSLLKTSLSSALFAYYII